MKRLVRLVVKLEDKRFTVQAYYHPKGYMKARYSHLDLETGVPLLGELARFKAKLLCHDNGPCIDLTFNGFKLALCPLEGCKRLRCVSRVSYLMLTRSGRIYLNGVECITS